MTLNELIDEVGTDAARFFFVMRSIDSQLDFDLDLAKKKSNDNPVFYVQYAHARICSIMRQVAEAGIKVQGKGDYKLLTEPVEVDLIKKLGEYPEMLATAAKERAVQQVAHYVYDLAGLFHSAYNQCRILGVNEDLQQARHGWPWSWQWDMWYGMHCPFWAYPLRKKCNILKEIRTHFTDFASLKILT